MKHLLLTFLFMICFTFMSCDNYHKEAIHTKGVVKEVTPINYYTTTEPKTKLRVRIDYLEKDFYFNTNRNIKVGDTIDVEIIFYKKEDDSTINYWEYFPKE